MEKYHFCLFKKNTPFSTHLLRIAHILNFYSFELRENCLDLFIILIYDQTFVMKHTFYSKEQLWCEGNVFSQSSLDWLSKSKIKTNHCTLEFCNTFI